MEAMESKMANESILEDVEDKVTQYQNLIREKEGMILSIAFTASSFI